MESIDMEDKRQWIVEITDGMGMCPPNTPSSFVVANHQEARNLAQLLSRMMFEVHIYAEDYYTSMGLDADMFAALA